MLPPGVACNYAARVIIFDLRSLIQCYLVFPSIFMATAHHVPTIGPCEAVWTVFQYFSMQFPGPSVLVPSSDARSPQLLATTSDALVPSSFL